MIGLHKETADRAGEHKASLKSQKYLKEVGCVYSIQGESGGLGRRPNESDKNNLIDKKSNMPNYKNTIVERLFLFYVKGYNSPVVEAAFHPHKAQSEKEQL